jgi:hypothetical protein
MTNDEKTNDLLSANWPADCGIKVYQPRSLNEVELDRQERKEKLRNQKLDDKKYFIAIRGVDLSKKIELNSFETRTHACKIYALLTSEPFEIFFLVTLFCYLLYIW